MSDRFTLEGMRRDVASTFKNSEFGDALKRLLDLADAVAEWRSFECESPHNPCKECRGATQTGYRCPRCAGKQIDPEQCDGDNHLESCSVKLKMDDVLAASNEVEDFRGDT